jgi:nucleotide-binding universal stress UspA family protein
MSFNPILVPVDPSGCAAEVVGTVADLAARLHATVILLFVVNLPAGVTADTTIFPDGSGPIGLLDYLDQDARAQLEPLRAMLTRSGVTNRLRLAHGAVVEAILDAAESEQAQLLVMGTHGRTGLRRLLEGSVAESVLRRSPCPVLVVRSSGDEAHPGPSDAALRADAEAWG